jgi:hypothetical protein
MKQFALVFVVLTALVASAAAQQRGRGGRLSVGVAEVPLPSGSVVVDTAEQHKIRVVVVTKELSHPWGMTW